MSAHSDPEKYSIDDMMERLKKRPAEAPLEDGELVTRADGTVAIKVRKRKRRSHQPHKEEEKRTRRARMIQASGAILLLLMSGFAVGSAIVYANSEPFRKNVIRMIATSTGAQPELEQFRVTPTRANAGSVKLAWKSGGLLKELAARGVSASIAPSSFFGKSLAGEEVAASTAELKLGLPETNTRGFSDGVRAPLPIRFRHYTVPKLAITLGDAPQPALVLHDTEASFEPSNANNRPQILLTRGLIVARSWPNILLDRAHIEIRKDDIDMVGMRLHHVEDNRGQIDLSGTINPHTPDSPSTLDVRIGSFLIGGIIGPDLGGLVSGRIDTVSDPRSNRLTITPGKEPEAVLDLSFGKTLAYPVELSGFTFLADLARLLEDTWFEKPVFEMDATGAIRRTGANVVIDRMDFQHKGRMALRGRLATDSARLLSGRLEVGVSEAMLRAAENPKLLAIFRPAEDGFRWIELDISGSCKAPVDNFMKLYEAATGAAAPPPGRGGIPTFDELIAPE